MINDFIKIEQKMNFERNDLHISNIWKMVSKTLNPTNDTTDAKPNDDAKKPWTLNPENHIQQPWIQNIVPET